MEYTREQAQRWLTQTWKTPKDCAICRNTNWVVSEAVTVVPYGAAGRHVPLFAVTCGTCGYTLLFNALVAGLTGEQARG